MKKTNGLILETMVFVMPLEEALTQPAHMRGSKPDLVHEWGLFVLSLHE